MSDEDTTRVTTTTETEIKPGSGTTTGTTAKDGTKTGAKAGEAAAEDEAEAGTEAGTGERDFTDPRPPSQVEAEAGARDGAGEYDPAPRAADAARARAYADAGIAGAPGSEVPGEPGEPFQPEGVRPPSQVEAEAEVRPVPGDTAGSGQPEDQDKAGTKAAGSK